MDSPKGFPYSFQTIARLFEAIGPHEIAQNKEPPGMATKGLPKGLPIWMAAY